MRTIGSRYAAGLAVVATAAGTVIGFVGCGSESSDTPAPPKVDASVDATQPVDSGTSADAADALSCAINGMACGVNSDCCSASCDPATKVCLSPVGTCKAAGDACGASNECCTFVCESGKCGKDLCISDNQTCTTDASCCGGKCEGADGGAKKCTPLNATCKTSGNTCAGSGDCCSKLCSNGVCSSQPSFCTQNNDVCSTDVECCGGICTKATGASLGLCLTPSAPGATGCEVAGQLCANTGDAGTTDAGLPACGGSCCSRACAPFKPGIQVCQPPSGCRPTGEACRGDDDCCGSPKAFGGNGSVRCSRANPSDPIGRCDNGNACRANGAICKLATTSCNAENNCCAGNANQIPEVCQQDLLGIPRCTSVGNCADAGSQQGKSCASSADCCGLPCVPNPTPGGHPFICGGQCVTTSGKCTTNADCCRGLPCVTPPGSSVGTCGVGTTTGSDGGVVQPPPDSGTGSDSGATGDGGVACALYGQECLVNGDCCNNIPCNGNRCAAIIF